MLWESVTAAIVLLVAMLAFFDRFWHPEYIVLNGQEDEDKDKDKGEEGPATASSSSENVGSMVAQLHRSVATLQSDYVSQDGRTVDYLAMSKSADYADYKRKVRELLPRIDLDALGESERKALLLNVYNMLVVDARISFPRYDDDNPGALGRLRFYRTMSYRIGEHRFSLDDIEHGLLRAGRPHPAPWFLVGFGQQIGDSDSRRRFAIEHFDPRIHAALNCGAVGCPPIRFMEERNVERGLQLAMQNFVDGTLRIVDAGGGNFVVELSKIFEWYRDDFGEHSDANYAKLLAAYLDNDDTRRTRIESATIDIVLQFADYDWKSNSL
jgi:Protein of unknown function, DUF547